MKFGFHPARAEMRERECAAERLLFKACQPVNLPEPGVAGDPVQRLREEGPGGVPLCIPQVPALRIVQYPAGLRSKPVCCSLRADCSPQFCSCSQGLFVRPVCFRQLRVIRQPGSSWTMRSAVCVVLRHLQAFAEACVICVHDAPSTLDVCTTHIREWQTRWFCFLPLYSHM